MKTQSAERKRPEVRAQCRNRITKATSARGYIRERHIPQIKPPIGKGSWWVASPCHLQDPLPGWQQLLMQWMLHKSPQCNLAWSFERAGPKLYSKGQQAVESLIVCRLLPLILQGGCTVKAPAPTWHMNHERLEARHARTERGNRTHGEIDAHFKEPQICKRRSSGAGVECHDTLGIGKTKSRHSALEDCTAQRNLACWAIMISWHGSSFCQGCKVQVVGSTGAASLPPSLSPSLLLSEEFTILPMRRNHGHCCTNGAKDTWRALDICPFTLSL